MCAEPMEGMCFFVEKVEVDLEVIDREIGAATLDLIAPLYRP